MTWIASLLLKMMSAAGEGGKTGKDMYFKSSASRMFGRKMIPCNQLISSSKVLHYYYYPSQTIPTHTQWFVPFLLPTSPRLFVLPLRPSPMRLFPFLAASSPFSSPSTRIIIVAPPPGTHTQDSPVRPAFQSRFQSRESASGSLLMW